MNIIKVIKTDEDYKKALEMLGGLMIGDPSPDSEAGEKLDLLATLIKDYESDIFPESLPDPIDAIQFRMEQQNLKPVDLVPYIGSRSKVSEVLSRKRPLTLSMIRALEAGLGIPAKVLVQEPDELRDEESVVWSRFPIKEMRKRGYFGEALSAIDDAKQLIQSYFEPVGSPAHCFGMLRKTNYRSVRSMDQHALVVWSAAVFKKAIDEGFDSDYEEGAVDLDFMRKVASFSIEDDGPLIARDFLREHGISLIIEPHFPKTYLDGATIMQDKKHPVIGLTLRHDRLDNFWFTLMHELAHISLHYNNNVQFFYDDLDIADESDQREVEADGLACEALVPSSKWEVSPAKLVPSFMAAKSLAKDLGVHISVVAGKMRREGGNYAYLNKIISEGKIRQFFPDENWN